VALAGAAVVPLIVLLWLWKIDVLAEAKIAVVDFNRWYVSEGFDIPFTPGPSTTLWATG
jgi:hypothetical protein